MAAGSDKAAIADIAGKGDSDALAPTPVALTPKKMPRLVETIVPLLVMPPANVEMVSAAPALVTAPPPAMPVRTTMMLPLLVMSPVKVSSLAVAPVPIPVTAATMPLAWLPPVIVPLW